MATATIVIHAAAHGCLIDDRRATPLLATEMKRNAGIKKGGPREA